VLSVKEGRFDYVDVVGEHLEGDRKIASRRGIGGRVVASEGGVSSLTRAPQQSALVDLLIAT
jgi:dihydroorotase